MTLALPVRFSNTVKASATQSQEQQNSDLIAPDPNGVLMSIRSDSVSQDNTVQEHVPQSVLEKVASRPRSRNRRRNRTSWLTLAFARLLQTVRSTRSAIAAWLRYHREQLITTSASLGVHLLLAVLMALWVLPSDTTDQLLTLFGEFNQDEDAEGVVLAEIVQPQTVLDQDLDSDSTVQQAVEIVDDLTKDLVALDIATDVALDLEPTEQDFALLVKRGEFGGRSSFGKQAALKKYGGTAESEQAVNAGLRWLQKIQQPDGSWNFRAAGEKAVPGALSRTQMGATSMALLCFLGAGHTHQTPGEYKQTVSRGLSYLIANARTTRKEADMRGEVQGHAGMYVQGIATICLCEAHAMEPDDSELRELSGKAIRFVESCQDRRGGGWRYEPREPGDTSVVGWQVMALQSAKSGDISFSRRTLSRAEKFLKSVQVDDGAGYRYMPNQREATETMTAVGLLCRMYLGWRHDNSTLERGVASLAAFGPSRENMYYNYYATQVLHHWGGAEWRRWNEVMREQLISTQIKRGPATGSWEPIGPHTRSGGQIYQTTLCLLTLEVYYRHLPMYRDLEDPDSL